MSNWLKVLLIIGVLMVVALVAVAGLGVYVWRKHGRGFVEGTMSAAQEGREYGLRTNERGCLDEAKERHRRAEGIGEIAGVNVFLNGCLRASAPTPGFCDGVPGPFEFMRSADWGVDQCSEHGLSVKKQCQQLFKQVQSHCNKRASEGESEPAATVK